MTEQRSGDMSLPEKGTPRTEAVAQTGVLVLNSGYAMERQDFVHAGFARELERELAESKRLHAEAFRTCVYHQDRANKAERELAEVRHDLARAMANHNADLNSAPSATPRRFTGVGHLEQTGYIPAGSAAERDEHCQNGMADVCLAGRADGVTCPEDSCDIDDGIRKAPSSTAAPHLLDEAGKFFDWGNAASVALRNLLDAYERRIRSLCESPEQIERKPWECAEYIEARRVLDAKPNWFVDLTAPVSAIREPRS